MQAAGTTFVRLFLALWPPATVAGELQAHADAWSWTPAARRTRKERLHVTLHFLGDVAADKLAALKEGLQAPFGGCELLLDRPTVWPGGIAVLEATQLPPELARLHADLGEQLAQLEVPMESRRYRPHVTLARKAWGCRPPAGFAPVSWRAGPGYDLVQSLPGGRGYESVQRF